LRTIPKRLSLENHPTWGLRAPSTVPGACCLILVALLPVHVRADTIESLGVDTAIALPLIAGGITVYKGDWTGTAELGADGISTVGTAYILKDIVKEQRPNKSDFQSFPSDTAAVAFAPAQFLWDRYGWQYGVPAYAAALFVGYSRVEAKEHHWYDVAASDVLAVGFSKLFTTRYNGRGFSYGARASLSGVYASVGYQF
jgi:membrane-associated phospholipid phosphatase